MSVLQTLRSPTLQARRERWWLLLSWLVLGVALAGALWAERRTIEAGERQRLEHQVGVVHDNLARQLQSIDSVLARLAREAAAATVPEVSRLQAFNAALSGVRTLNVLDASGRVVASSRFDLVGTDAAARDYFRAARAAPSPDTLVVGAPFANASGEWLLTLARVVRSPQGDFAGTAMATLDPAQFHTLLESVRYAPDMRSALLHGGGQTFLALPGAVGAQAGVEGGVRGRRLPLAHADPALLLQPSLTPDAAAQLVALRTLAPPALHMDQPLVALVARARDAVLADWRATAWAVGSLWLLMGAAAALVLALVQWRRRDARTHAHALAQTEATLEARWRAVLDATSLGMWEWQAATPDKTYFSPGWRAMLGYEDGQGADLVADWDRYLHPDESEQVLARVHAHLRGRTPVYESTHRLRCHDGSWRWVTARGQVIERDAQGRPLRFVGTYHDAAGAGEHRIRLDHLAQSVPGMLYQFQLEPDGRSLFPYASAGMQDIYGYPPEALRSDASPAYARIHPEDLRGVHQAVQESARSLQDWHAQYRVLLPERGERWLQGQARPQALASGAVLWHGYLQDVTESKRQALQLQQTERLLQHLMQEMPIGLNMVDETGRIYFRNRRFLEYFGHDEDTTPTLEQWWPAVYPDPAYRAQVMARWQAAVAEAGEGGDIAPAEYRTRARDGTERTMFIGGVAFGGHFLATFVDRTEQQAQNELLRTLAFRDGLTGVANRRHFDQMLHAEWRRCRRDGQPLALLLLDIDHFKQFNDRHGHQAGDECLRRVAQVLRAALARSHDLVARYGGEEFACLLPNCGRDGAIAKAMALLGNVRALDSGVQGSGGPLRVSVSIGVAVQWPDAASSPAALLARADAHLYRAKALGRDRVDAGEDAPAAQAAPSHAP